MPLTFSGINLKVLYMPTVQEELIAKGTKHTCISTINFNKENGINILQFLGRLDIK